jgi:hypothetical protein
MNIPTEQATLYRKAAETIEMCAKHGVEPIIKYFKHEYIMERIGLSHKYSEYEFPITVISGQLVWADTVVYDQRGNAISAKNVITNCWEYYTLTQPKQPLCMVEGKPVYSGDEVYDGNRCKIIADRSDGVNIYGSHCDLSRVVWDIKLCSWSPKPNTVMVEFNIEDAQKMACGSGGGIYYNGVSFDVICNAFAKALDNLKGDKS